jgi:hypothetical protein
MAYNTIMLATTRLAAVRCVCLAYLYRVTIPRQQHHVAII